MEEIWESPRKIEEDIRQYRYRRFEYFMSMVDIGLLSKELAIAALKEEIEYSEVRGDTTDER